MKTKELVKRNLANNLRSKSEQINFLELKNIIKMENAVLIDVRSEQEYKEGHLKSAINIPFYEFSEDITKRVTDKSSPIIIYCQSGIRSNKIMKELKKLKYNNIYELEGGLDHIY